MRTVNNINDLSTAQSDITSLQENVNTMTTNITTLQSYTVSKGTNFGVSPDVLQNLTTGTQNTALGNGASAGMYGLTTGSGNVMVGYNSGGGYQTGSNNNFLGANTQFTGATYISGSIALGEGATVSKENQLVVVPTITSFNISGLTTSTGTGTGTILEYNLSSNVLPKAGTYNNVSAIDTIIAAINAPYAMSWASNSEYTYDSSSSVQALTIWDTLNFGNSANMASKSTWTCPVAGLWHIAATFGFIMNTNDKACSF